MGLLANTLAKAASSAPAATQPAGALPTMDAIDWCVFAIAIVAIPVAIRANWKWWRKARSQELPRDWQSFWMIVIGLLCMVAIVCWYLFKFILPACR